MQNEQAYQQFLNENCYPRILKSLEIQGSSHFLNFSSSDYLGLSQHPVLKTFSQKYIAELGVGAGSSRLVSGNLTCFNEIENKLATVLQKPAALILGSGYQTNISILEALLDNKVLKIKPSVFADKLCHVSLLQPAMQQANLYRFLHNDYDHLEKLLKKYESATPKFILVESVYSMEGDQANLKELIYLAQKYEAFLYLDDAHAVGMFGKNGWGFAADYAADIPIVMGTFSKALGSFGGYIGCSDVMKKFFVNKCKGLIYSTALSPAILGAIAASLELVSSLHQAREKVLIYSQQVRDFFQQNNMDYGTSTTQIVPWIIGDAKKTREISQQLEQNGILATAIQPPSVPIGKSRIRFCLSAAHTEEDIQCLLMVLKKIIA